MDYNITIFQGNKILFSSIIIVFLILLNITPLRVCPFTTNPPLVQGCMWVQVGGGGGMWVQVGGARGGGGVSMWVQVEGGGVEVGGVEVGGSVGGGGEQRGKR